MVETFKPILKEQHFDLFDGIDTWKLIFYVSSPSKFEAYHDGVCKITCASMTNCINRIREISKPPFVELTLEDFRVAAVPDTNVVYINNETGVGFAFMCDELKFAYEGTRYNSAAEVIAAINEKRRKEYDANK